MSPERATIDDLTAIVEARRDFWCERDLAALHHPLLIHEFGDTALVLRDEHGGIVAYLFGFLTPAGVGYIHLLAVHRDHRRAGLARTLYEAFEAAVRERGAIALKAFTRPGNGASISFHRSLGFSVQEVGGYAWGEPRVVFWRELQPAVSGRPIAPPT